ncbi:hypothetical protein [Roseibium sp. MB-4]
MSISATSLPISLRLKPQEIQVNPDTVRSAIVGDVDPDWSPPVYVSREQSMAMTTPSQENNTLNLGNITTLNYKAAFDQYNFVDSLVESGQFDADSFRGFNGAEQAETADQYLFWLQARMQEIGPESG